MNSDSENQYTIWFLISKALEILLIVYFLNSKNCYNFIHNLKEIVVNIFSTKGSFAKYEEIEIDIHLSEIFKLIKT